MKRKIKRLLNKLLIKRKRIISNTNTFGFKVLKYIDERAEHLTIIDIGANRGCFLDEFQSIYQYSEIEALLIEPIPECIQELKKKYSENVNISFAECALSNEIGTKEFFINQYDVTSSLLKFRSNLHELDKINTSLDKPIKLMTNTLDNVAVEKKFDKKNIDIIKIDVQGTEDKVLLGATKTLRKSNFVWIEVSFKKLYDGSCLFTDVHEILTDRNFVLIEIIDEFRSPQNEILQANCLYKNIDIQTELI